jgi:hypothetical protein
MKSHKHVPGSITCICLSCQQLRLTYVLTVARNKGDICAEDFHTALLVMTTMVSLAETPDISEAG